MVFFSAFQPRPPLGLRFTLTRHKTALRGRKYTEGKGTTPIIPEGTMETSVRPICIEGYVLPGVNSLGSFHIM